MLVLVRVDSLGDFERELACLRVDVVRMSVDDLMARGWFYTTCLAEARELGDDLDVITKFEILIDVVNRELVHRGVDISFF